jgi:hypothetical protein
VVHRRRVLGRGFPAAKTCMSGCYVKKASTHTRSNVQEGVPGDSGEMPWPAADGSSPACDSDEPKHATGPSLTR